MERIEDKNEVAQEKSPAINNAINNLQQNSRQWYFEFIIMFTSYFSKVQSFFVQRPCRSVLFYGDCNNDNENDNENDNDNGNDNDNDNDNDNNNNDNDNDYDNDRQWYDDDVKRMRRCLLEYN